MAQKGMTARGSTTTRPTPARQAKPRATKAKPAPPSKPDEVEEYEDEEEEDELEESSTLDIAAVMKAFASAGAKKDNAEGRAVEQELATLLSQAASNSEKLIETEMAKCEQFVRNLMLDDKTVPGPTETTLQQQLHDQLEHSTKVITALDEFVESMRPANQEFCKTVLETIAKRPKRAKNAHHKFYKAVRDASEDQVEIAENYSKCGPDVVKGFKAALRV